MENLRSAVILFFVMTTMVGCNKKERALRYYNSNEEVTGRLYESYELINDKIKYKGWSLHKMDDKVMIMFNLTHGERITYYCDFSGVLMERIWSDSKFDSLILEGLNEIVQSKQLNEMIKEIADSEYSGISGNDHGVFFSLCYSTVKHPHPDAELGVFFSYGNNFNRDFVLQKLDSNIYLYETVVP